MVTTNQYAGGINKPQLCRQLAPSLCGAACDAKEMKMRARLIHVDEEKNSVK